MHHMMSVFVFPFFYTKLSFISFQFQLIIHTTAVCSPNRFTTQYLNQVFQVAQYCSNRDLAPCRQFAPSPADHPLWRRYELFIHPSLCADPTKPLELLNLTFGVEFEFVVAYKRSSYPGPIDGDFLYCLSLEGGNRWPNAHYTPLVYRHIADTLGASGIPVNSPMSGDNYDRWTVCRDESITTSVPEMTPPDDLWSGYYFVGVELKTPILPVSAGSFEFITKALSVVQDNFSTFVNESCGLHLHVGDKGTGLRSRKTNASVEFPLNTIQSLATIVTVFDSTFSSLHPPHRINNKHCLSSATNFRGCDPYTMISKIRSTDSIAELTLKMSSDWRGNQQRIAYNFLPLTPRHDGRNTIEFRQHAASLHAKEVEVWVRLCCGLVDVSHNLEPQDIDNLVVDRHSQNDKSLDICELLQRLGLVELARYYGGIK